MSDFDLDDDEFAESAIDLLPTVEGPMEIVADAGTRRLHEPDVGQRPGPRSLSPSSASVYRTCPRRWKFRYVDNLADPPGEAALAGTFAHRVLEVLMQLPGAERSIDQAKVLARQLWPETEHDPDFQALELDDDKGRQFRWRAWKAIEGLWRLEDPSQVNVDATEAKVSVDLGGVPFRGIVDRVDRGPDGALVVADYKSGRAPSERFAESRLEQVLLYAAAVQAERGEMPRLARLLYLAQRTIEVEVTIDRLATVVGDLGETHRSLTADMEAESFDPTPGPLCGWCPYADRCPEGLREVESRYDSGRIRVDAPALVHLINPVTPPAAGGGEPVATAQAAPSTATR